jgi:predicted oxidoreductase
MVKDGRSREQKMYIIGDHKAVRTYGIGFAKPFPVPLGPYLKSGYLIKGNSIAELARNAGIDPAQLERTVSEFNDNARWGVDAEFGKGEKIYERFQGDATHGPNPCVGPLEHGPYYAVRMLPGDIGTFGGLKTDELGRVLKDNDRPVIGLHAVGNDMASIFGGAYPGGGATLGPAMTFGFIIGNYLASKDTAEMAAC